MKLLGLGFIVCGLFLSELGFAVTNPVITGSIQRGGGSYFDVSVKVGDSKNPKLTAKEKDLTKDRLQFFFSTSTNKIPYDTETPDDTLPFLLTVLSEPTVAKSASNATLSDLTFSVRIKETKSGALKTMIDNEFKGSGKKQVKLQVKYLEDTVQQSNATDYTAISVNSSVVKDAPKLTSVAGTERQLIATYNAATTATFTDNSQGNVTSVVMVAIRTDAIVDNLPAYKYDSSAAEDTKVSDACFLLPSFTDGNPCVRCVDGTYYLDTLTLSSKKNSLIYVATSPTPAAGKVGITDLENGKEYIVFTYFEPNGIAQSSCYRKTPIKNYTPPELSGESDAELDNPRCFIATAAYGSPLHKNLRLFTWFRGHVLLKFGLGKKFVRWYYKNGPAAAEVVAKYPALAFGVRMILWVPALLISVWLSFIGYHPVIQVALVVTLAGALGYTGYLKGRKRYASP